MALWRPEVRRDSNRVASCRPRRGLEPAGQLVSCAQPTLGRVRPARAVDRLRCWSGLTDAEPACSLTGWNPVQMKALGRSSIRPPRAPTMIRHITLDPDACAPGQVSRILEQAVAPRPIALVSTMGAYGRPHLHPVSWYSSAATSPPVQYFVLMGGPKHPRTQILSDLRTHGEFVINTVDEALAHVLAGAGERAGQDFDACGCRPRASVKVAPYRVAESPAQMECKLLEVVETPGGRSHLIFGAVVQFHLRDDLRDERGRIDQRRLRPVGQLSKDTFCRCRDLYRLRAEGPA